jgi:alcohol dehydrogenase
MKAAQLTQYGGKEAIAINDVETPQITDGKVLVEVHAAGVNPFDWKIQLGYMKDAIPLTFPVTLGGDLAGVVKEVGQGVTNVAVGDEVYGQGNAIAGATGAFAEYDLVLEKSIAKKPTTLDFEKAGAIPLTGVSAIQGIYDHLQLSSGQKILIHGGAGGIGSNAIQLAKDLDAYVITTVSTDDVAFAKELGADEVIDYKSQKFEEIVNGIDAVFDMVGHDTNKRSYQVLRNGGKLVSMVAPPDEDLMKQYEVEAIYQSTKVTTDRLTKLAELIDKGVLQVHVEKTFPLEQAGEALEYLHDTPPKGNIVIKVK